MLVECEQARGYSEVQEEGGKPWHAINCSRRNAKGAESSVLGSGAEQRRRLEAVGPPNH